jgi:hypothetical protein
MGELSSCLGKGRAARRIAVRAPFGVVNRMSISYYYP